MNKIEFSAKMAELADASYFDYDQFGLDAALKDNGFSDTQAQDFESRWSVVPSSYHSDASAGSSGFSATLFKGNARVSDDPGAGDLAGHYVLAIRGTKGAQDIEADLGDIVLDGLAVDQIIDLYNYTQETPGNTRVRKHQGQVLH